MGGNILPDFSNPESVLGTLSPLGPLDPNNPLNPSNVLGSKPSTPAAPTGPTSNTPQIYTPNLNAASNAYLPDSYRSNAPITDPSAILNAYSAHIPEFQAAAQSSSSPTPYDTSTNPKGFANNQVRLQ